MAQGYLRRLIPILILIAVAVWIVLPENPGLRIGSFEKDIRIVRGLDLQGGLRILLEADLPPDIEVSTEQMQTARDIVENRVNALGVTEPLVQLAGSRRILVELPGIENPDEAIATIKETGLLEFVEILPEDFALVGEGLPIQTDFGLSGSQPVPEPTVPAVAPLGTPAESAGTPQAAQPTATASGPTPTPSPKIFHTVMTGSVLKEAGASVDQAGEYYVGFVLTDEGTKIFGDYTSAHVGDFLAIVLDKEIISMPRIETAITEGSGRITGKFTVEEANRLAVQLRYGSLPVPLTPVDTKSVGPTLGEDSLRKSTVAGAIGLTVVIVFMILFYGLPGLLADFALLAYAVMTFSLFKLIPVTLTLPGIAGFVLSIGVAVDANILIFERTREELRLGRTLRQAIDLGFSRAWPSIRDSNLSTLITCAILYWFGNTFGASIVKGFSLTLALGVAVSLFTAITVTRTFLHTVLDRVDLSRHTRLFGV